MAPTLVVRVAANLEEFRRNLKEGSSQIETTKAQLERLSKSFNGEKLVQSAHNVTAAINKVGVATLNTSEGARSLNLLDKAMDKLLRTGQQVPPEMMKTAAELRRMGRATEEADKAVNRISGSYRQFDGILQSLGINVGPYVKGLEDITSLATGGASSLGLLAGAAAVVGVAIGAWKLGQHAGEMYGWTEAIARGTAALKGYGDVYQETVMAQADAANGLLIYEANLKRQADSVRTATEASAKQAEETRRNWTVTEGNADALANLQRQLDAAAKKRREDAIATFQASQAQSIFGKETEATTAKIHQQTEALDEREQSLKKIAADEAARKKKNEDSRKTTMNESYTQGFSADLAPLTKSQLQDLGTKPGGRFDEKNLREKLAYLEGREGTIRPTNNEEFFALQRENVLLAQLRMYFQGYGRPETLDSFAGGVTNFRGGVAKVHKDELLVNMPKGTDVIPAHRASGMGGTHITIAPQLIFRGPVVGSTSEFQDIVSATMLKVYRDAGLPFPSAGLG